MTLTQLLTQYPPCVVRYLARQGVGRACRSITHAEIAAATGMSEAKVLKIAKLESWDRVPIGDAVAFMSACGFDLLHTKRAREYLRRSLNPLRTEKPFAYTYRRAGRKTRIPDATLLVSAAGV